MGKLKTLKKNWHDQNGYEPKTFNVLSSYPHVEDHAHMSIWPSKCGQIELNFHKKNI